MKSRWGLAVFAIVDSACLNVDHGGHDGGQDTCFKEDDVGMVCGWDDEPALTAFCTIDSSGELSCCRSSTGGRCLPSQIPPAKNLTAAEATFYADSQKRTTQRAVVEAKMQAQEDESERLGADCINVDTGVCCGPEDEQGEACCQEGGEGGAEQAGFSRVERGGYCSRDSAGGMSCVRSSLGGRCPRSVTPKAARLTREQQGARHAMLAERAARAPGAPRGGYDERATDEGGEGGEGGEDEGRDHDHDGFGRPEGDERDLTRPLL
jgi:hypothetical protein